MAGHQPVRGVAILVLLVPLGEHVLFLRLKHGKAPDLFEIPGQAGFAGCDRGECCCLGHIGTSFVLTR